MIRGTYRCTWTDSVLIPAKRSPKNSCGPWARPSAFRAIACRTLFASGATCPPIPRSALPGILGPIRVFGSIFKPRTTSRRPKESTIIRRAEADGPKSRDAPPGFHCARVRVMNDDNGELPSFGLGGPIDASRAQKQKEQEIERWTREMLAQALSNWRKTKRGRPKAQWREKFFSAISRTMDSHPDEPDTKRARILSEEMRPKVDIRTVQNWLSTVRKRML